MNGKEIRIVHGSSFNDTKELMKGFEEFIPLRVNSLDQYILTRNFPKQ